MKKKFCVAEAYLFAQSDLRLCDDQGLSIHMYRKILLCSCK